MRRTRGAVLLAGLVAACRATPGGFTLLFLGRFPAAAAHGAARSPYYIPQFRAEPDTAPLIAVLDTLGRPVAGLATIHVPATAPLTQLANAGAVTVGPDGAIYFAPLIRDEIRKYGPGGDLRW